MATVKWNKRPRKLWREALVYGHVEFGKTAALRFVHKTNKMVAQLEKFPETGAPERLLQNRKAMYRSYHLLPHLKIIYRYYPSSDMVRIVDVWNTRMNPKTLAKRIKQ